MFFNKKIKCFLLILLCILFIIYKQYAVEIANKDVIKEIYKEDVSLSQIESTLKKCSDLEFELKFWSTEPYYNSIEDTYYFLIDEKYFENYTKPKIEIESEDEIYFSILSDFYNKDEGLYVDSDKIYDLLIYDDVKYNRFSFKFICIPIVNITTSQEITTTAQPAQVEFYMEDHEDGIGTTQLNQKQ